MLNLSNEEFETYRLVKTGKTSNKQKIASSSNEMVLERTSSHVVTIRDTILSFVTF